MKHALLGLALLAASSCGSPGVRSYNNSDAQLAVGNAALMACTCHFVMNMPDDFCRAWVKASPDVARFGVNKEAKTVESSAFITWSARAHFVDDKRGCVLE